MWRKRSNSLKFYDATHEYEYNGVIIPSVSEILRFMSREVYGDIDKYILDNAAERGTAVHAATEQIDATGECEIDERWAGYVQAYVAFVKDCQPEWIHSEKPLVHPKMLYAGTPDRHGYITAKKHGRICTTIDLKTTGVIHKSLVKAQVNGYKKLEEANGYHPDYLHTLQLLPTGKYRLYEVAIDDTEFMACYALHQARNRKHGRGRID